MNTFFDSFMDYLGLVPGVALQYGVIMVFAYATYQLSHLLPITAMVGGTARERKQLIKDGAGTNHAYLLRRGSLVAAQVIALLPAVSYTTESDLTQAVMWLATEGLYVMVCLWLLQGLVDLILLWKVNNLKAVLNGNMGVATVEAGMYAGLGFILRASLDGNVPGDSQSLFVKTAAAFGLAGTIFVIASLWVHEAYTPYSMRREIERGHTAVGVRAGGYVLASSIIVSPSVGGDFTGWGTSFAEFFALAIIGMGILMLLEFFIDLVFLHGITIKAMIEENRIGRACMLAAILVLSALVIKDGLAAGLTKLG